MSVVVKKGRVSGSGSETGDAMCGGTCHERSDAHSGFGLVGLLVIMVVLGLMVFVAIQAIPSGTNTGTGVTPLRIPGGTANVIGGAAGDSGGGASPAVPGGLIPQSADTVAQENLRTALTVVDQAAISAGGYGTLDASSLAVPARGVLLTAGASGGPSQISVAASGDAGGGVTLALRSASGTCWFVWRSSEATVYGSASGRSSCAAPASASTPAAGAGGIDWQPGSFPAP